MNFQNKYEPPLISKMCSEIARCYSKRNSCPSSRYRTHHQPCTAHIKHKAFLLNFRTLRRGIREKRMNEKKKNIHQYYRPSVRAAQYLMNILQNGLERMELKINNTIRNILATTFICGCGSVDFV